MQKTDKIPTVSALLVFSWAIAGFGITAALFRLVLKFNGLGSAVESFLILVGSLVLAVFLRAVGSICQMLFDLNKVFYSFFHVARDIKSSLESNLGGNMEKVSCDLKDINQNIQQIKAFFEQIEKHLNFKK